MTLVVPFCLVLVGAPTHGVLFSKPDTFAAWPANGGLWAWGDEASVAFVTGKYELRLGHNLVPPYTNRLARTADGGRTWTVGTPPGFYQPGDPLRPLADPIPFDHPDLAMRFVAIGYQGGTEGKPGVCYSLDRGRTWKGTFALPPLLPDPTPTGRTEVTLRTDYLPTGKAECLVFASARLPGKSGTDRLFAAKLTDGGRTAAFLGWVRPPDSPDRLLMPATVRLGGDRLFTAVRVRKAGVDVNWIDGLHSADGGKTWTSAGKVGDTGTGNGNPPAVVRLRDGRLACAYGDRTRRQLLLRLSTDDGRTWGAESVLRADYQPDALDEVDLGYPRLFERADGVLIVVYYWATKERPVGHIAWTAWGPD